MPAKRYLSESEQASLREAFFSDKGVNQVSEDLSMSYQVIQRYWRVWFTEEQFRDRCSRLNRLHKTGSKNPMYGKTGLQHHRYKESVITSGGYREVPAPDWWRGKIIKSGRLLEHILVCCESLGLNALPKGCVVHHKDEDRLNNDPSNLELMTIGEHLRLHNTTHGRYVKKGATTISTESSFQEEAKRNPS